MILSVGKIAKSENLKKFSNWEKSEYFVIVYDARFETKNNQKLVSTPLPPCYKNVIKTFSKHGVSI